MPRLVLLDLDDTLLRQDKTISAYSADVLRACQSAGVLIAFATARGEGNIRPFIEQIQPDIVVSSSGALIRCWDEIIDVDAFTADETAALLAAGLRLNGPDCLITVDGLDGYYGNYCVNAEDLLAGWGEIVSVDLSAFREPALKICVNLPNDSLAMEVAKAVPGCDWLRFSGGQWYKFTKANINKERAAARLSELLRIAPEDMIAFGDDYSDIGLLRYCGTGVAVANAIPEVKAVADVVVASNDEDGPAVYLSKTVLQGIT